MTRQQVRTPPPRPGLVDRHALLGLGLALLTGAGCSRDAPPAPPNIFLVSLDTLRADALQSAGRAPLMPTLERLAADGVLYEHAYTTMPFTLPAHMTLLTGLHHTVHGVIRGRDSLPAGVETLPQVLREQGYATCGLFTSEWLKPDFGFGRGFELYERVPHGPTYAPRVIDRALEVIDSGLGEAGPFFVFLHLYDAHSDFARQSRSGLPYHSPAKFRRDLPPALDERFRDSEQRLATEFLVAADQEGRDVPAQDLELLHELYRRGVRSLDSDLEGFFRGLRDRGLYDEALIIVTSDHGEEFREHGLFLHSQVYGETVRVPLIVKLPGAGGAGSRHPELTTLMDLTPLMLVVAGADRGPAPRPLPAAGAAPGARAPRTPVVIQDKLRKHVWGLVTGGRKLVIDRQSGAAELYLLEDDPSESDDVSLQHPAVVHGLRAELEDAIGQLQLEAGKLAERGRATPPALTEEEARRLEALGYVDAGGAGD